MGIAHLDLDTLAWEASGVRKGLNESVRELRVFIDAHDSWVIEGCYGSLIADASKAASELVFLNPGVEACKKNCLARPWEPHKYESIEEQDRNLKMLLKWVTEYETRTDECSLNAHRAIFASFDGIKQELKSNMEAQSKATEILRLKGFPAPL